MCHHKYSVVINSILISKKVSFCMYLKTTIGGLVGFPITKTLMYLIWKGSVDTGSVYKVIKTFPDWWGRAHIKGKRAQRYKAVVSKKGRNKNRKMRGEKIHTQVSKVTYSTALFIFVALKRPKNLWRFDVRKAILFFANGCHGSSWISENWLWVSEA